MYFPVSKYHLTNIYMKEDLNNHSVVNVKNDEKISNKLGQNLSGLQICPNFGQNNESESIAETFKRISRKVNFNVIRDSDIPFDLMNYSLKVLYSLPLFRDCIN